MKHLISVGLSVLMVCFSCHAFSGKGTGTAKNPYQISTADELFEMRNDMNAYYVQMEDIDLIDWIEENSPKYGWAPIGNITTPFNGNFDGNNKQIRNLRITREETDNVGLFGFVEAASISNLVLVNPQILAHANVGGVVGYRKVDSSYDESGPGALTITHCYVIGGAIKGQSGVGGIIGGNYSSGHSGSITVEYCHNSATISGQTLCGGICGSMVSSAAPGIYVRDCFSIGNVTGTSYIGGIIGHAETMFSWISKSDKGRPDLVCERNYVRGNITGEDMTNGVIGNNNVHGWVAGAWGSPKVYGENKVSGNVCIADTIKGNYRIAPNVQSQDNYAAISTVMLMPNGKQEEEVMDNEMNGTSMGLRLLQKGTTYESLGWNFDQNWKDMSQFNEFPVHIAQSAPPVIKEFDASSKTEISGEAAYVNGTVFVMVKDICHTAPIIDGKWKVSLGKISPQTKATVFGCASNQIPSVFSEAFANKVTVEPIKTSGDANGDGIVDAADVVSIINHIIGKSSSSFNALNADVNGDGQVLVDDAVGAVELIMNAQ